MVECVGELMFNKVVVGCLAWRPLGGEEGGPRVRFDALLVEHVLDVYVVVVSGCAVKQKVSLLLKAV